MIQKNIVLKLPPKALIYRITQTLILVVLFFIFSRFFPQIATFLPIAIILFLVYIPYAILYFLTFSYFIAEDAITINSGIIFKSSKITNYNNFQNVEVKTGPMLMVFGLANLQGFTSSPAQLVISSSGNGHTSTQAKPDVFIVLLKEDAQELAQMMRVGDVQRVKQV